MTFTYLISKMGSFIDMLILFGIGSIIGIVIGLAMKLAIRNKQKEKETTVNEVI